MNTTTQKLISSILTGFIAKLLRYAMVAAGTTYTAANGADGTDAVEAATQIVSVGLPVAWSMWEDWVRSKQTSKALNAVESGATKAQALADTTTLKKTDVAKPPLE